MFLTYSIPCDSVARMTGTGEPNDMNDTPVADEANDEQWAPSVRLRRGTRRRLEDLIDILSDPNRIGAASLPQEVAQVFRDAFRLSRRSYTPDVLVDTAVAALSYMLTSASEPKQPERRKTTKGKGR